MTWDIFLNMLKAALGAKDSVGADPLGLLIVVGIPMLGGVTIALIKAGSSAWPWTFAMALALMGGFAWRVSTAPPPASGTAVRPAFQSLADTTLSGRQLMQSRAIPTAAACETSCAGNAECIAYTFDPQSMTCQLLATVGNRIPFAGPISGIKQKAP